MAGHDQRSLYAVLAEEAPEGAERGETVSTKRKETVDNDVEAFALVEGCLSGG